MFEILKIVDLLGQIGLVIYALTFYWIVRSVRRHYLQEVRNAVKNPLWPNLDLKFVPWVYKTYIQVTGSRLLPAISVTTFFIALTAMLVSILGIGQ